MVHVDVPRPTRKYNSYAIRIRPIDAMPAMATVGRAQTLPGTWASDADMRRGSIGIEPGDCLLVGEQQRYGYSKELHVAAADGTVYTFRPDSELRTLIKTWVERGEDRKGDRALTKAGVPVRGPMRRVDLRGSGDNGVLARVVVALHGGLTVERLFRGWLAVERLRRLRAHVERAEGERFAAARRAQVQAREAAAEARRAEEADWAATMATHGDAIASAVL